MKASWFLIPPKYRWGPGPVSHLPLHLGEKPTLLQSGRGLYKRSSQWVRVCGGGEEDFQAEWVIQLHRNMDAALSDWECAEHRMLCRKCEMGTEDGCSWGFGCSTSISPSSSSNFPVSIGEGGVTILPLYGKRVISSDHLLLWKPNRPDHPLPTIT